jgi:allantoinase
VGGGVTSMLVLGGSVVDEERVRRADLLLDGGRIVDVLEPGHAVQADTTLDASGLHVLPGLADAHVHFNEPGRTDWEDIAHGSAALAAGGYTCFVDMPLNNLPVTTTVEAYDLKVEAMKRSAIVDWALWAGLVPGNLDQLAPLAARGALGFKAFMCPSGIDEFPACDLETLRAGMETIAGLGSILLVHAEAPASLSEPHGPRARDFIDSRPPRAEIEAVGEVIAIARDTGCRAHVVHVSTVQGMTMIAEAQLRGVDVSGETCPHYLLYEDGDLERLGGAGKCAPPFRAAGNRDDLRAMVFAGEVEMVVSDHSPSAPELKRGNDFRAIWGGIAGCQSTRQLLLALEEVEPSGVGADPSLVAAVTATNVARRFGLAGKGDIAPGFDADLWLVDLGWSGEVRAEDLLYEHRLSAHVGRQIRGRTVRTLLRGHEVTNEPTKGGGQPIRRVERS